MHRSCTIALGLTLLALLPWGANADVVVLKSGGRFSGVITSETDSTVTIQSEGTVWSFKRDKISSIEKEAQGREQEVSAQKERTSRQKKEKTRGVSSDSVIVYGTSWCGYCRKARAWFAARHIPYVDLDVEEDPSARAEITRKCLSQGQPFNGSVPVLDVYGRIIHGFDERAMAQAVRAHDG